MDPEHPDSHYDSIVKEMNPELAKGINPYGFDEFITCQKLVRALIRLNNGEVHPTRIEVWFRKNAAEIAATNPEAILPQTEREWNLWYSELERMLPGFLKHEQKKKR